MLADAIGGDAASDRGRGSRDDDAAGPIAQGREQRLPHRAVDASRAAARSGEPLPTISTCGMVTCREIRLRFSRNALMPSLLSCVRISTDWHSRSSMRPVSVSMFWHMLMITLPMPMACGARLSRLAREVEGAFHEFVRREHAIDEADRRASCASIGRAAITISLSRPMPIIWIMREAAPEAGMTPS